MIRVLHSVSYMSRGGIETMLMNYYRHIDRNKVQFDFLCNSYKEGAYDNEIRALGGNIFRTPGFNPLKYFEYQSYMKRLFSEHPEYSIVEAHNGAMGVYALNAAKKAGVPTRIYHAHGAGMTVDIKFPIKYICKHLLKYNMNEHFICSLKAGEFYLGRKLMEENRFHFISNAIDVNKFIYNVETRNRLREIYNLKDKLVIGHVGRFTPQKNHFFLIEVFAEALKLNPNLHLVLIGEGEREHEVKRRIDALHITDYVTMTGSINNTNEWYQVFDLFLMPSLWEGLPVVGVEAQCADLPCVFSTEVTNEISLSPKTYFISLKESPTYWGKFINDILSNGEQRTNQYDLITEKHYNIEKEAQKLQNLYISFHEHNIKSI